ncbi:restriction endonuclease subunit S [Deinococcus ficus]|uniref:restriction endonuclease subunit S n=1 Tax=Deinococcus ficus TaxID=317577 RepID=UPI0004043A57|nr:restriction endonuclease subunit S [Deinococcus ficus]
MTSEWRTADLIAEGILEIGDGYRAKNSELATSGLPFARAGNINNGFNFSDADLLGSDAVSAAGNKISQPGDVVFTSKGTVGRFAFVGRETPQFVYSPQLCYWRSKEQGVLHPRFLYYWMQSSEFLTQMAGVKGQTDMADYVSLRDQRAFKISVPAPAVQHQVASILSAFDDKIELNRRMNRTLEQMARSLFKSWFVDFDPVRAKMRGEQPEGMDAETAKLFPDALVEVDGREAPEGWKWTAIADVTAATFSGGTPDTRKPEYWNGGVPWFSSGETRTAYVTETEKTISQAGVENSSTRLAIPGDILIASAGQGFTRGQTSLNTINTYINQSVVAVRVDTEKATSEWLYLNLSSRYEEMRGISDGHSSRGSLTTKLVAQMPVVLPPETIIAAFTATVQGLIEAQVQTVRETAELAHLRDTLLPQLLSGQLDITSWADETEQVSA